AIKYELGLHLLLGVDGKEKESIPFLEQVVQNPDTPLTAWKMLGYACLWDEAALGRSVAATDKYLALFPQDSEAKLWRAAANARLISPNDATKRPAFLREVESLVREDPSLKKRILDIEEDGEADDFKDWRSDPEFRALLTPYLGKP